jgi:hypothetical protein
VDRGQDVDDVVNRQAQGNGQLGFAVRGRLAGRCGSCRLRRYFRHLIAQRSLDFLQVRLSLGRAEDVIVPVGDALDNRAPLDAALAQNAVEILGLLPDRLDLRRGAKPRPPGR